jgi:hypothetical protein
VPSGSAEQLHRGILAGDRADADVDERSFAAAAAVVQVAGERLLAAAGLAGDHHPAVVLGDALDLLAEALHGGAAPDRRRQRPFVLAQVEVFALQLVGFERAFDGDQQLGHRQRFLDEVVRAETGRLDRGLDRPVSGDHDHRARQTAVPGPLLEQRDAVEIGHPDVEQREVRASVAHRLACRVTTVRGGHLVTLVVEDLLDQVADRGLVVDDQDVGLRHRWLRFRRGVRRVVALAPRRRGRGRVWWLSAGGSRSTHHRCAAP